VDLIRTGGTPAALERGIFHWQGLSIISQRAATMHSKARKRGILDAGWPCTLALAALAPAGGCWQEVPYDPATRPPRQSSTVLENDDLNAVPGDSGESEAGDIFGGDDPSNATPVDPPPVESAAPVESVVPPNGAATPRPTVTVAQRQAVWTLATDWSIAAALSGRGQPPMEYAEYLQRAGQAAQELGIVLPELPTPPDAKRIAADMAGALRGGSGAALADAIGQRLDAAAAGAARLAITAHVLLLVYTPLEADAPAIARELREAGAASQLPPELWRPLVDLVSRRSEYEPVKAAVFALRQKVADHYAAISTNGL
jgi:hypothetical protein